MRCCFWFVHTQDDSEGEFDFLQNENGGDASTSNPSSATKTGGRKFGTSNLKGPEREYMLDLIEEILPLGQRHWIKIAKLLNEKFNNHRDGITTCRKRFNAWVNEKGG